MMANPEKLQCIILQTKPAEDITINIKDCCIVPKPVVKPLGININNKLSFDHHISILCKKATWQLLALKRISSNLNYRSKVITFNAFVISNFNYCPLVWHHCSKQNTIKIEKIQERGLRVIFRDHASSYKELLNKSSKDLLYINRIKRLSLFVYRCLNKIGPAYLYDLFEVKEVGYNLRGAHKEKNITQPKVNTTKFGLNSLKYSGSVIWNKLPPDLKSCVDEKSFKTLLKSWSGPSCFCGACVFCKSCPS